MTDPEDMKRTQLFHRATPVRTGFVVSRWIAGPPDEESVETPLRATAALLRSIRDWWRRAPIDPRAARVRTAMVQLSLECRARMRGPGIVRGR